MRVSYPLIALALAIPSLLGQNLRGKPNTIKLLETFQDQEEQVSKQEEGGPRSLTGALEAPKDSVRATMPIDHPSNAPAVGTPPLQTLQGQALGPADLPVLLPFASPYVNTP